jgi:hypothetical protein
MESIRDASQGCSALKCFTKLGERDARDARGFTIIREMTKDRCMQQKIDTRLRHNQLFSCILSGMTEF